MDTGGAVHYWVRASAAFGMIQDLARLIVGMDPLENEVVWEKLYKSTFWAQNGGPIVFSGLSAIDLALWDIKGKHFGVPIYRLLGGKKRDKLRSYASQLQFGWGSTKFRPAYKTQDYYDNCKSAVAEGYDCVKIGLLTFAGTGSRFPSRTKGDCCLQDAFVSRSGRCIPEAMGDRIYHRKPLQYGCIARYNRKDGGKYGSFISRTYTRPEDDEFIHDHVNKPIASGKHLFSWHIQYFENLSLQVIQPDLGNFGGSQGQENLRHGSCYDLAPHSSVLPHIVGASLQ
jgi:hypothetical protein